MVTAAFAGGDSRLPQSFQCTLDQGRSLDYREVARRKMLDDCDRTHQCEQRDQGADEI
jgi:hypothetical protein